MLNAFFCKLLAFNTRDMIKNYLITALRNLSRNKTYAVINIIGLSIGISCAVIAYLMIDFMTGFDKNHSKKDRIYRVVTMSKSTDGEEHNAGAPLPILEALKEFFPEFEKISGLYAYGGGLVTVPSKGSDPIKITVQDGVGFTDENFYQILDREWLQGNRLLALKAPNRAVLSVSLAEKLFPGQEALNKTINLDNSHDLIVAGVVEDLNDNNTDFNFDLLVSFATIAGEMEMDEWGNLSSDQQCFVLVRENTVLQDMEKRMEKLVDKYYELDDNESKFHPLQPFSNIHYNKNYVSFHKTVSKGDIWTLFLLALFLIITAAINFVNLATAQAIKRSKEVGVRKVLGGFKAQIRWQFLVETMTISLLAIIISMGLAELLLIKVNQYLELSLQIHYLNDLGFWGFLLVLWMFITLLSGLYPAFVLSGFRPVVALKNSITTKNVGGMQLRKGLIVFQFVISQVLVVATIVVMYQMHFMKNQDMGFEKEAILTIELPNKDQNSRKSLVQELKQIPTVSLITSAMDAPASNSIWKSNFSFKTDSGVVENNAQIKMGDKNYVPTYGLTIMSGKNLTESDTINGFLINETLARYAGFTNIDDAVGQLFKFGWNDEYYPIVGVVNDFHSTSFKHEINPTAICQLEEEYEVIGIKLASTDFGADIAAFEKLYKSFYPDYDFSYKFMDDVIERFYRGEEKMFNIIRVLTMIAIFIGCLGLYGLVSFMANQKVKEIGIRKVLGASFTNIIGLFSIEFLKLITIAFVIALPLAYLGMSSWLQDFIYKIDLEWWIFLLAISVTLVLALLTVSYKTVKSALSNPVDCLKDE